MPWEQLLGPVGLTVFAIWVSKLLWDAYLKGQQAERDLYRQWLADVVAQRDTAVAGWKAQVDATNRLGNLVEEFLQPDPEPIRQPKQRGIRS